MLNAEKAETIMELYNTDRVRGREMIWMLLPEQLYMGLGTVGRYMKKLGIASVIRKKKRKHQKMSPSESKYVFDNILNREFTATRPNEKWVTDITYLHSTNGTRYLSCIKDLYDNTIIAHVVSDRNDNDLVINTLEKAIKNVGVENINGTTLHSDRGHQYTSKLYRQVLEFYSMDGSHSRLGNPYDNASMESFFSTFKTERYKRIKNKKTENTVAITDEYIDYYNHKRPQRKTKKLPPILYREQFFNKSLF